MRLSVKGLAMASGILWGFAMLGTGLANLIWGNYGQSRILSRSSCSSFRKNPLKPTFLSE